jgi:hypothetical protein
MSGDTSNAALEGDDAPQPLRVFLYKDGYASVNGEVLLSAFGPNPVRTIARKLIAQGRDPDAQELLVHHGGERVERVLLRDAAAHEVDTN